MTVTLKAALITDSWTVWSAVAVWGSLAVWLLYIWVYDAASPVIGYGDQIYGITQVLFSSWTFWLALIIVPIICMGRAFVDD